MTLATDILKRAGVPLIKQKPKRGCNNPPAKQALHTVRVPGMYFRAGYWEVNVHSGNNRQRTIAAFLDLPRAILARRLFIHWLKSGYAMDEIPNGPKRMPNTRQLQIIPKY